MSLYSFHCGNISVYVFQFCVLIYFSHVLAPSHRKFSKSYLVIKIISALFLLKVSLSSTIS